MAADAERAVRRYNNVQLDGQPMQVGGAGKEGRRAMLGQGGV